MNGGDDDDDDDVPDLVDNFDEPSKHEGDVQEGEKNSVMESEGTCALLHCKGCRGWSELNQ